MINTSGSGPLKIWPGLILGPLKLWGRIIPPVETGAFLPQYITSLVYVVALEIYAAPLVHCTYGCRYGAWLTSYMELCATIWSCPINITAMTRSWWYRLVAVAMEVLYFDHRAMYKNVFSDVVLLWLSDKITFYIIF